MDLFFLFYNLLLSWFSSRVSFFNLLASFNLSSVRFWNSVSSFLGFQAFSPSIFCLSIPSVRFWSHWFPLLIFFIAPSSFLKVSFASSLISFHLFTFLLVQVQLLIFNRPLMSELTDFFFPLSCDRASLISLFISSFPLLGWTTSPPSQSINSLSSLPNLCFFHLLLKG